jgi:hypothetical protein
MNSRMPSKVPTFRTRPTPGVRRPMFLDLSKLTDDQIETELAELAVKIPDQSYCELREAELEAKQILLTAELKSRREGRPKPTIEEIERELAQVKDKLDEACGNWQMKGVGELESRKLRLEFQRRFLQENGGAKP